MQATLYYFWDKIKSQIDLWFFFGFLLIFTLSIRKILFFYPIQGSFNEYSGLYIYASDILLILTIFSFIFFILCNNNSYLSMYKPCITNTLHSLYTYIPLFLVVLSFLSIIWSQNQAISLYRSIKILEGYFLYIYVIVRFIPIILFHVEHCKKQSSLIVPRGTKVADTGYTNAYFPNEKISKRILWLIYGILFTEWLALIIAISQFASIGLPLAFMYIWIIIAINPTRNQKYIVPRGTLGLLLDWSILARSIKNLLVLDKTSIVPRGTICEKTTQSKIKYHTDNCSTWNNFLLLIMGVGVFQSIIAIWQFIIQRSIDLLWLKESLISQDTPGVAKIILDGHRYIRAYGLFPHPNILGGFLLFSIIITLLYKKIIVPRGTIKEKQTPQSIYFSIEKIKVNKLRLIYGILFIQAIALFLTFSKSAIIGLLVSLIYIGVKSNCSTWNNCKKTIEAFQQSIKNENVPRGTIESDTAGQNDARVYPAGAKRLCGVEQFKKITLTVLIILALLLIIKPDINALFFKSLGERRYYLNISQAIILNNLALGIGEGQFVTNITQYTTNALEVWQFQPVHNVFLLIWSELGIFGLGLFIWFIFRLFHNCSTWNNLKRTSKLDTDVPRGTIAKLVEYNIIVRYAKRIVAIGADIIVPRGTINESNTNSDHTNKKEQNDILNNNILCNDYCELSTRTALIYFQGILLGFIFIILFDHYLWDIWQGQVMFWLVVGVIAGIKRSCYDKTNI